MLGLAVTLFCGSGGGGGLRRSIAQLVIFFVFLT